MAELLNRHCQYCAMRQLLSFLPLNLKIAFSFESPTYMQNVLCSVTGARYVIKVLICVTNKGALYAYAYIVYV